jgi:hypothetical protein
MCGTSCTPHFCNLLYMVYMESPLCSWGSAFGLESDLLSACLLPESFGAWSLCLSPPTIFLGACLGFGVMFPSPCSWLSISSPLGGSPLPGTTSCVDVKGGSPSPGEPRRQVLVTQRNPERPGNQLGNLAHQTGKNLGSNLDLP